MPPTQSAKVQSVEVESTCGGCYATLLTLDDGRIVITTNIDPTTTICADRSAWDNSEYSGEFEDLTTALLSVGL